MTSLQKQKVINSCPSEFGLVKRFWKYILDREVSLPIQVERSYNGHLLGKFYIRMVVFLVHMQGLCGDTLWASISNNSLISITHLLKHCTFEVTGKV